MLYTNLIRNYGIFNKITMAASTSQMIFGVQYDTNHRHRHLYHQTASTNCYYLFCKLPNVHPSTHPPILHQLPATHRCFFFFPLLPLTLAFPFFCDPLNIIKPFLLLFIILLCMDIMDFIFALESTSIFFKLDNRYTVAEKKNNTRGQFSRSYSSSTGEIKKYTHILLCRHRNNS